jgi:hypothetical protein
VQTEIFAIENQAMFSYSHPIVYSKQVTVSWSISSCSQPMHARLTARSSMQLELL